MNRLCHIIIAIFWAITVLVFTVIWYVKDNIGVTLNVILYTLTGPLGGANTDFLRKTPKYLIVAFMIIACAYLFVYIVNRFLSRLRIMIVGEVEGRFINLDMLNVFWGGVGFITFVFAAWTGYFANQTLQISQYIIGRSHPTRIYEDRYVEPSEINIIAPENKRNLLLIYIESMETTYASEEAGGRQKINYIQNLTNIADDNCSFSNTNKLGGFHSVVGTNWTFGAIFSTSSGIPYAFPVGGVSGGSRGDTPESHVVAEGSPTIGDVLAHDGYTQEFLCGSDGNFAGRRQFYEYHGGYDIFDYYSAIEKKYIPEGYYVWWGLEDKILYQIAKDELLRLADGKKPFNLTMLTADTHCWGGYICDLCEDKYPDRTANVVSCADRQLGDFIEWCKLQSFYDNTTIVLIGDHPCMDNYLCEGVPYPERTVYNCIINAHPKDDKDEHEYRDFTAMDMFPTMLSAMGYSIEGNQLGLGVDLFSGQDTLIEEMGYDDFTGEISSYSQYYVDKFR